MSICKRTGHYYTDFYVDSKCELKKSRSSEHKISARRTPIPQMAGVDLLSYFKQWRMPVAREASPI